MFKWSFWYEILRIYMRIAFYLFFRKVKVFGIENIPLDKAVIFAPNHQNALMDPLAIVFTNSLQTVFLTRADIFNRPFLLKIFTFLKMLPVYRIRDGKDNLSNNDYIFKKCVELLQRKKSIALFPEAQHNDKMYLLPLKKAIPRIAFQAEIESNFQTDVYVVPVGIFYDNYTDTNSYLRINYGKAVKILDYQKQYFENPQKCMNQFREDLYSHLSQEMVNVQDVENYSYYIQICNILWSERRIRNGRDKFDFYKNVTQNLYCKYHQNSIFDSLKRNIDDFNLLNFKNIPEYHIHRRDLPTAFFSLSFLILLLPVFIYGFINHIAYYLLLKRFLTKKFKDKQFHSSIKFGFAAVAFPIIYLFHTSVFYIISESLLFSCYYFLSLPISGWITNKYKYYFRKWLYNLEWFFTPLKLKFKIFKIRAEIISKTKVLFADEAGI